MECATQRETKLREQSDFCLTSLSSSGIPFSFAFSFIKSVSTHFPSFSSHQLPLRGSEMDAGMAATPRTTWLTPPIAPPTTATTAPRAPTTAPPVKPTIP
jgi:hypothetical protein